MDGQCDGEKMKKERKQPEIQLLISKNFYNEYRKKIVKYIIAIINVRIVPNCYEIAVFTGSFKCPKRNTHSEVFIIIYKWDRLFGYIEFVKEWPHQATKTQPKK